MQSSTLKQRHPAAIGLLLVGTLFLVAACGGSARSGPQPSRTSQAALTTGGYSQLAPVATTIATPTPTSATSPKSAPSAMPTGAATPVPADPGTDSSNHLLPGVMLAALALVALYSLPNNGADDGPCRTPGKGTAPLFPYREAPTRGALRLSSGFNSTVISEKS